MLKKLLLLVVVLFSASTLALAQEFTFPVTVSDGTNEQILNLKIGPNGATTSVTGDVFAPPAPPAGAFDARIRIGAEDYFTKILPNALTAQTFPIVYVAGTGAGPITLSWDPDLLDLGTFQVTDNLTGTLYTQDMSGLNGTLNISTASGAAFITAGLRIVITPAAPPTLADPTFDPAAGAYEGDLEVTLSSTDAGATIFYTTDGTDPSSSSTEYTGAIELTAPSTTTIKAIAIQEGFESSQIVSATYTLTLPTAAVPTASLAAGNYTGNQSVTLSTTTAGATIYYTTDGSAPTTSSTEYTGAIALTAPSTTTIRAIAGGTGFNSSAEFSGTYTLVLPTAAVPTFSPAGGNYTGNQSVSLSTATSGATIYYTTDGTDPTTSSAIYSTAIQLTAPSTTTIKAIAGGTGLNSSSISSATYTLVLPTAAAPTASLAAGNYTGNQSVGLTTTTSGATIYYTTDGSTPTTSSTVYTSPITLTAPSITTIRAIAGGTGFNSSAEFSGTYTLMLPTVATPTFNPVAGNYEGNQSITISTTTSGATIYYTTDGTDPTTSSTVYSSAIALTAPSTTTLKALAVRDGYNNSTIASAAYTLVLPTVATPTFSPAAGSYVGDRSVSITTSTSGATIYFTTDGTDPTTESAVYSTPIALTAPSETTIKALAVRTGYNNSTVASGLFSLNLQGSETPVFSLASGEYIGDRTITLTTATEGASIFYTTDGSAPTTSSTLYTEPIELTAPSETTIRAVAGGTGFATSSEASRTYTLMLPMAAAPGISPNGGNFFNEQAVMLSTSTPGGSIYYTTDGSDPTPSSMQYSEPINLVAPSETTIKAYVVADGYRDSDVSEAMFVLTIRTDEEAPVIVASEPKYEDVDQDPVSGAFSYSINVEEGVTEVMTFAVVNEEDPVTWSLAGGANASLFNINQDGDVSFKSPAVEGTFVVVVRATDSAQNSTDVTLTVIVGDGDGTPPPVDITPPYVFVSAPFVADINYDGQTNTFSYTFGAIEGATDLFTFSADEEVTWSINGGANANLFIISNGGAVSFKEAAAVGNFVVVIRATDMSQNHKDVTVTVAVIEDEDLIGEDEFEIPDEVRDLFENVTLDFNEDDFEIQLKVETLPNGTRVFAFVAVIVRETSKTTGSGQITNQEFANPDIIILAENDGASDEIILTKEKIDAALLEAGIFAGETVTLKWTLRATGDDFVKYAPKTAELTITRDDDAPNPVSIEDETELPSEITLNQNYPNPFNPSTSIRFSLPASDMVSIQVYSITGQLVATLLNETRSAGFHTVNFDATNLSSGIYVYRLTTGTQSLTKKMLLVK